MTRKQQSMDKKNSSNYLQRMFRDTFKSGYNFINNRSNKVKSIEIKKNWCHIQLEHREEVKNCERWCLIWQTDQVVALKWHPHKTRFQKDGIF